MEAKVDPGSDPPNPRRTTVRSQTSTPRRGRIFWWFRSAPDRRLQQEVDELRWRLNKFESSNGRQQKARADADFFLGRAECELDQWHAATEEAWAWFHAARREELCFLPPNELALVELDQKREVEEKLDSWRRKAVASYSCDAEDRIDRIVRTQMHIDETAETTAGSGYCSVAS